jgi:chorismate dehydratase
MAQFTVGSVPYVNAIPLIGQFLLLEDQSPVDVLLDVPSRLPRLLDEDRADAILVSSVEALRRPGASVAGGVGIISRGPVESVRLFSRTPFDKIRTLALDESSMTSSLLAQALLREIHGCRPETYSHPPCLSRMLEGCDACLLIGDLGMEAEGTGLEVMDLGEAWVNLTGLPFVWAMWLGRISPQLSGALEGAWHWSGLGFDHPGPLRPEALKLAEERSQWGPGLAHRYLTQTMSFGLDKEAWQGLDAYRSLLEATGLASGLALPARVMALPKEASVSS